MTLATHSSLTTTDPTPVPVAPSAALAFRRAAWANGYRPLPVRTGEKRPADMGWPELARQSPPPCARPDAGFDPAAASTGILADGLRIIDVDVDDGKPDAARIADYIRTAATLCFGETLVRVRADSPRLLLVYRASAWEPKKVSVFGPLGTVEILGKGQQFVADGLHPAGLPYQWEGTRSPATVRLEDIPAASEERIPHFLALCRELLGGMPEGPAPKDAGTSSPCAVGPSGPRERAYAATALDRNAQELAATATGRRNDTLNAIAYRMGKFVAAGWIDRDVVEDALTDASDRCGLTDDDGDASVLRTLESGLSAGMKRPVGPLSGTDGHPVSDGELIDPDTGEILDPGQGQPATPPQLALPGRGGAAFPAEPLPLYPEPNPQAPYPVDSLGPILGGAAAAIASKIQTPASLAAGSVLATASLAAQAHVDVRLPFGQVRPVSLFLLTVAASGDRKSSADEEALRPVRRREKVLRVEHEAASRTWATAHGAWAAMKRKLEQKAGAGRNKQPDYETLRKELEALGPEPEKPLEPILVSGDMTIDGLTKNWTGMAGSLGLFTAEGGQFSGGHNMTAENKARSAAMLSELWDRGEVKRVRAGDGISLLRGRRLSLHLMMQPGMAAAFLSDELLQDQGLFSRVLIAAPASIAGTRLYRHPTGEDEARIARHEERILQLLARVPPALGKPNELAPRVLPIGDMATKLWQEFFDRIERATGPGGDLVPVRALAAKAAEHAARIAAVITMVETPDATEIGPDAMAGGIALADWYVREAVRLVNAGQIDPELRKAQDILAWIEGRGGEVSFQEILRKGPGALRNKRKADAALRILADHGRIRETSSRPRRVKAIGVNRDADEADAPAGSGKLSNRG